MNDGENEDGINRQGNAEYRADGLLLFDESGALIVWDAAMEQITGIPRTEVLGKKVWDSLLLTTDPQTSPHPDTTEECIRALQEKENPVRSFEFPILNPCTGILIAEWILFTLPPGGRIRGGSVVRDITARKKAEEALLVRNRKLLAVSSTIRHDINNQLTILGGYLSLMEGGAPGIETAEIVRILQGASDKIERILKFTREYQDIGSKPPVWLPVGESFRMAGTEIEAGKIRLFTDPACDGAEVLADPLFVRVFYHLIDNSIRHGKKVSVIRVRCSVTDGTLQIVYEDDGTGIPDRVRPLLFERGKGKNSYGLFLAREILSATGITITESGSAGAGARFVITVPPGSFRAAAR